MTVPTAAAEARRKATVTVVAVKSQNIDTECWRGDAVLSDLTLISQADVFDQVSNPSGLQRDLSPKHSADAYKYVSRPADEAMPRAYPEVMLNVRDESVISVEPITTGRQRSVEAVKITFDLNAIQAKVEAQQVAVSRMDGNHRLFYGAGDGKERTPVSAVVPFQLHIGLTPDQETNTFVDVNANQKGLNSSHLHVMRSRLTPEEQELLNQPERVFARKLTDDEASPWHNLVHMGGSKAGSREEGVTRPVTFVTLESGVKRILSKSQYLDDLPNPEAKYRIIRNFWNAVAQVFEEEWAKPKDYLLLKNIGVLSFSIFGATVIDKAIARNSKPAITVDGLKEYVSQIKETYDWHREAVGDRALAGYSGNKAALIISGTLAAELSDPGQASAALSLQEYLLSDEGDESPAPAQEQDSAPVTA